MTSTEHPRPPRGARTGALVTIGVLVGLGVGACLGSTGDSATVAPPEPAPTVTRTVETPGPARTVTPDVCLAALTAADTGFTTAGQGFAAASDGFGAIRDGDLAALTAAAEDASALQGDMGAALQDYQGKRDECRAAAGEGQ